ncbi:MAG: hypothetical protein Q9191_001006 [Dirinaria sp. TL-2023a]
MHLHVLLLLAVAWCFDLSHALFTPPTVNTRCWAKALGDVQIEPASCLVALRGILQRYPQPVYTFSKSPYPSPGTVRLPLVETHNDCTIMVDIFYVTSAREAMSKIVATADRIIEDCVGTRQHSGGSRAVGTSGLWIDVLPTKTLRSGRITIGYSNGTAAS